MPSVVGDVVGGLAGSAASSLFGGGDREFDRGIAAVQSAQPYGFAGGGLRGTAANGAYSVARDPVRARAIRDIQGAFRTGIRRNKRQMRDLTRAGGALKRARLREINRGRQRALGDLRESLARRRIAGSSFANDTISRAEAEFAEDAANARAISKMEQFGLKQKLLDANTRLRLGRFQTALDALDLEGELAARMAQTSTQLLNNMAQTQADMWMQAGQTRGEFLAPVIEGVRTGVGDFVTGNLGRWLPGSRTSGGGFSNPYALNVNSLWS